MLGIFLIIFLAAFWFIRYKASRLFGDSAASVTLDTESRTYEVCRRAMILYAVSKLVALIGYLGCAWPYLLIEGADRGHYLIGILFFGVIPIVMILKLCYSDIQNARGYIRISTEGIEYQRGKSFSVKIGNIKTITYSNIYACKIILTEKDKKPLIVNLKGFHKKSEVYSLIKQLRDHSAALSGQDKNTSDKLECWSLANGYVKLVEIGLSLVLLYTSYCCIDYDYFRKDYTADFNALNADPTRPENAWAHYVQAAATYIPLDKEIEDVLETQYKSGRFDLTAPQADALKQWFEDNRMSWIAIQKATSIQYCNAAYDNISLDKVAGHCDFSNPTDHGYNQIHKLYQNATIGYLSNAIDLDWFDLLNMQLVSSKHFMGGKTFIDQLFGYSLLDKSIRLLGKKDHYEIGDLQKAHNTLKERFPEELSPLSTEGEILIFCSGFNDILNHKKIPMQSPLNPSFLQIGSCSGSEASIRKHFETLMKNANQGIDANTKGFWFFFPLARTELNHSFGKSFFKVYRISKRIVATLQAGYVILDLEEYRHIHDNYPADVLKFQQDGLISELPDDPYGTGKIVYINDGQRAVLYSVGLNGKDDGGYRDEKDSSEKRDDIVFWERKNLTGQTK